MHVLPVDEQRFRDRIVSVVEIVASVDGDGNQRKTKGQQPIWTLRLLVRPDSSDQRTPEVAEVQFPADRIPKIDFSITPRLTDLQVYVWPTEPGMTRLSFWASAVFTAPRRPAYMRAVA